MAALVEGYVRAAARRAALALVFACGAAPEATAPAAPEPYARPAYTWLSETGLYADPSSHRLAGGVIAFEPAFELWSDGADKRRWMRLPEGTRIDTSDMDRWQFPIGTRVWKEFSLEGLLLETRLLERYGSERDDYWMGAFVWSEDRTDASFVELGKADLLGTPHDAPASERCLACHNGEPGRILGFSALQLARHAFDDSVPGEQTDDSDEPGEPGFEWTLAHLVEAQRLSTPPEHTTYAPPGDAPTAEALGYLHANCGHCHNPRGTSWPDTQMLLRLDVESTKVEETGLYQSVVNQALQYYRDERVSLRVASGDPGSSALIDRMQVRGPKEQMPPLASELVDEAGVALVSRWISSLSP